MTWLLLALLAAICESLKDLFSKKGLQFVKPHLAALAASASAFPILIGFFFLNHQIPPIGDRFLFALTMSGLLNIVAILLFMKAIQESDLSLTIPFISFSPLFLLLTSPFLVQEFPGPLGILGVFLIVLGSYFLQIQEIHRGYFAPFGAILKEKGPKRMLVVAFIYSLTSNFDKIGVLNSSPMFWSLSVNTFMILGLIIMFFLLRSLNHTQHVTPPFILLLMIGLFHATTLISQNSALEYATVPSVISVKRTSTLFAVILGYIILRETQVKERLGGAVLMILGVACIGVGEEGNAITNDH